IFGYERSDRGGKNSSHQWNGLSFEGYLGKNIGFSFDFRDNSESGNYDAGKIFTPETGIVRSQTVEKTMEYSETRASVYTYWSWGEFSISKDFLVWGYGEGGNIVNSNKAPSFPMARLDIYPVEWLRFNYIHGWLSSDVIDSSSMNSTAIGSKSFSYRDKYFVSHTFIVTPLAGLDISLGESIIYSDKFQPVYLIPIIFFRAADHYVMNESNDAGGNAQFFLSASSRGHIKNTHLYGSLFIDDITLSGLFDSQKQKNQIGFMLGGSVTDLPVNNLTAVLEYTKIYPYVYRHYVPTLTYENAGYLMGHWMGNNADQIYASLNYRIIRGLAASAYGRYIRKGEEPVLTERYTMPPQPVFLSGLRTNYSQLGFEAKYEFIHNLFARAEFVYNKISREQETGGFVDDNYNEFSFAVYYGL
ncbi:MAG TPA: capsule assembly Wzi family protein, partial [Ignavibacteriales bacterium]|nr:capsule assembly Wzi family protein [Ignavibacteriales bacterium]